MPFNLGALAGGTAQGFGQGLNYADQYENAKYLRDQRDTMSRAQDIWGKTIQSMAPPQAPMPQPPAPGQASQALPPPNPMPGMGGGGNAPSSQGLQYSNGVPLPPPKPPEFGGSQMGAPPPVPQQAPINPLAPQGISPYINRGSPPPQAQQLGAPLTPQSMQAGQATFPQVMQQIIRANPDLDPKNPKDMRALVAAAGQALPFMRQGDQEYYRALTLSLQQQRADTARTQGEERLGIARDKADTARDQGWERIRQSADRLAQSAEMHKANLELNQEKLIQARKNGDVRQANLIERQIENDTKAVTGYTNAYSKLMQSTTPSQREDPAIQADIAQLQARMGAMRGEPSPGERRGGLGQPKEGKPSGPRNEDAAPLPQKYPKVGETVNGYKLMKPDFTKDESWVYVGNQGTPEVPKVGERPELAGVR